jgi:hypothetical protein
MFKYLGQHIFDFVSKFRNDVYFQNLEELEHNFSIVVGPDGKLAKSKGPAEKSIIEVRNDEGSVIPAGAPLYSKGEIGGSDRIKVGICDASDPAKMPCIGIAQYEMNTSDTKDNFAITQGVYNTNISGFTGLSEGDTLYVNGGAAPYLTSTKPSNGNYIQNVGIVLKTNGTICQGLLVSAIGRTNDVPWPLYVDVSNSKVGIGTTSPAHKLDVSGDINIPLGSNYLRFGGELGIKKVSNGAMHFYAGTNSTTGGFDFATWNGSSYNEGSFVIRNNGNVGISTTSPIDLLHIRKDQNAPTQIRVENASNTSNSRASITVGTAGNAITMARYLSNYTTVSSWANRGGILTDSGLTDGFFFRTSAGAISFQPGSNTDSVVFDTSGNVGIGTTNPAEDLHVVDDVRIDHQLFVRSISSQYFSSSSDLSLIYGDAANFTVSSYATERMRITSAGNVGIGTTNPTEKLHVQDIGTSGVTGSMLFKNSNNDYTHLYVQSNGYGFTLSAHAGSKNGYITGDGALNFASNKSSGGSYAWFGNGSLFKVMNPDDGYSTPFVLNHNNRVGIGTTSPTTKLTISQSADSDGIEVIGFDDRSTDNIKMHVNSSGSGEFLSSNGLRFNAVSGQVSFLYNSNLMMQIASTSVNIRDDIELAFGNDKDYSIGYNTADDTFRIVDGSNLSSNPRLTINSTGNVGIGTTTPDVELEVEGTIKASTHGDGLVLGSPTTPKHKLGVYGGNDLLFKAPNGTVTMAITSGANIGIGTTSPTEKLEVSGNIKASGTIKGKMEQMFACSFSDDLGTTKHYLSFTSNAEQTNVHADQAAMVMPYNGRVKSIQLRLSNIDADTIRTFGIETIAPGINMYASSNNWTIEETEAYELAATDDFYLVNYVFSNTSHFESGDLLAISIQDTEDAYTASRQTYVNVIIEYDLNNGMGNDTATTKYTS